MTGFLLDTHIWYWHIIGSPRLPERIRIDLEEPPWENWLSPISIWELALQEEHGRIGFDRPLRDWVRDAKGVLPVQEAPVTDEIALAAHELSFPHRDPADRLIAATAFVYGLTLLTVDERLAKIDWLETRSG